MQTKKYLLFGFIALALVQLFVPAQMIWQREKVMQQGTEFQFRTAPIDPNDPFRGKYITLRFEDNNFQTTTQDQWERGEEIYLQFIADSLGFATIHEASKTPPTTTDAYLKTTVEYAYDRETTVYFPFDRFYLEESKAMAAEIAYQEANWSDNEQEAAAIVRIQNGAAVLKDVSIDGKSIVDIVRENQE